MDRLARLPIGKTTFQSMVRRHILWAVLNGAVSVSLYFVVKCVARLVFAQYGTPVPVFQPLELAVYLVMSALLLVYIYHAYIANGARFGGTHLTLHRVRAMLMNIVVPGILGAFCGKSLLSLLQTLPVTSFSILTFNLQSQLAPALSGAVALVVFFSCPSSPRALQSTPKPVASSFIRQIVSSGRSAVLLGSKIAASVALTLCVLRALESVWLHWACNATLTAASQSSPLCSLYALNSSLSVYMPTSSLVVDGGVSLFVAVALLFQVELLLESLSFMSTYPLDFQKLRWQLLRAEGGSVRAGEAPNEQLLLQALLIGQDTAVNSSASLDPLSHGSSNYSENTALSEAQVQQVRQARLVDSVVSVGMQPPVVPYFGEGANLLPATPAHRKFPTNVAHLGHASEDSLVNTVGAVGAGLSAENREALRVGKFDLLARSLAFQDLHRLVQDSSEVAVQRRAVLFAKSWAQVLAATCGMIDAASLQVHLLDEFLSKREENEDLLLDDLNQDDGLFHQDGRVTMTDSVAAGAGPSVPRHSSSFENILRLRASLAAEERDSTHIDHSHQEKHYDKSIELEPSGLRARTMYRRDTHRHAHHDGTTSEAFKHAQEVLQASRFLKGLQEWVYLGFYGALQVPVPGYGVEYAADLPVRAFPPMCATSVVHAIESIAALLLLALSEDASGYTQRSVCPVVRSLLTLETSLAAYCSTLQASQFVRISSMGRIQQIRYRARSESAIPDSIRLLQGAVQQALNSMVRAYRDVLLIVVTHYDSQATTALFSRTQVTALEAKLMATV